MALCHKIMIDYREYGTSPDEPTLEKLLKAEPKVQEEFMCAAGTLGMLGLHEQALEHLLRLMDFQPNNREYLHNLAVCHYNCGSCDKALAVWTKLQKLYPMSVVADYYVEVADAAIKNGRTESVGYGYAIPLDVFMERFSRLSAGGNDDEFLKYLYYAVQTLPVPFQTMAVTNSIRIRSAKKAKMFLHELLFYPRVDETVKSYAKVYLELGGEYFDHYAASADGVSMIPSPVTDPGDIVPYTQIVWLILGGIDAVSRLKEQQRAVAALRMYMLAIKKSGARLSFGGMESAFAAALEYVSSEKRAEITQADMISKYHTTVYRFKKALDSINQTLSNAREGNGDEQHAY